MTRDIAAVPLNPTPMLVAISDFRDGWPPADGQLSVEEATEAWRSGAWGPPPGSSGHILGRRSEVPVVGGYLERLPLACVRHGLVDHAEIWHHWRPADPGPFRHEGSALSRRAFHLDRGEAPFSSTSMLGFVEAFGAPEILCVWGLGVDERLLRACARSIKIYNSIDAPALRIPPEVSRHFDLVLTGAEWQSREVRQRHSDMTCLVMPIGPEYADPETFRPLGTEKIYDIVYVAAAQPYKRHDILFDALARMAPSPKTLCVLGYGEEGDALRGRAAEMRLAVDFVGPPGVPFEEVNRLMNRSRVGVVCGIDDGAPSILTEYMLAGLPVLANARLRCGLQYITDQTGLVAEPEEFHEGLSKLLKLAPTLKPRSEVLDRWTWPHTVARLAETIGAIRSHRQKAAVTF